MLAHIFLLFVLSFYLVCSQHMIDLSWAFNEKTTVYAPGMTHFNFSKQIATSSDRGYWYSLNEFCTAEHGGTHFDAPYHFYQSGWKVADVPLSRLFAKGALINLGREHTRLGRDSRLKVKDLEGWETKNGPFAENTVLLVKFGRSRLWENRTAYLDLDGETMNFPGLSKEAAQWIANTKKIVGVGVDTPSIDPGNSTDFIVHRILSENSLYNLENVKLLVDLPEKGFDLIVAPMKIEEGTGAAVRIFAVVDSGNK